MKTSCCILKKEKAESIKMLVGHKSIALFLQNMLSTNPNTTALQNELQNPRQAQTK